LKVGARSSIMARPRSVRNGQTTKFSGKLRGGFVPEGGKLVDLQAFFRGRWRSFATPRADRRGKWRYRYRFGATRGLVTYRIRARIPHEAAYPFEAASSRVLKMQVRG
jgi:hypothetical protein